MSQRKTSIIWLYLWYHSSVRCHYIDMASEMTHERPQNVTGTRCAVHEKHMWPFILTYCALVFNLSAPEIFLLPYIDRKVLSTPLLSLYALLVGLSPSPCHTRQWGSHWPILYHLQRNMKRQRAVEYSKKQHIRSKHARNQKWRVTRIWKPN